MRTFKSLRRGDVFTLAGSDDQNRYVKLGNHGARKIVDGRIIHTSHCIPALYDKVMRLHNVAD